jgi:predicted enzyme related to lactoylglutathione lyase
MAEVVTGIGGVFFKAKAPSALARWYRERLGVGDADQTWAVLRWRHPERDEPGSTVWAVFSDDTDYFGAPEQRAMVNYRVRDLDAMLDQLRRAGVEILDKRMQDENGRFAWIVDPEGNRIELWEPAPGY